MRDWDDWDEKCAWIGDVGWCSPSEDEGEPGASCPDGGRVRVEPLSGCAPGDENGERASRATSGAGPKNSSVGVGGMGVRGSSGGGRVGRERASRRRLCSVAAGGRGDGDMRGYNSSAAVVSAVTLPLLVLRARRCDGASGPTRRGARRATLEPRVLPSVRPVVRLQPDPPLPAPGSCPLRLARAGKRCWSVGIDSVARARRTDL